jgi:anti-sigma factor RsiW
MTAQLEARRKLITAMLACLGAGWATWSCAPGDQAAEVARQAAATLTAQPGVTSKDRNALRIWLAARLDYAPPLRDFPEGGLTLAGASTARLDGQTVAILLYDANGQRMAVALWPGATAPRDDRVDGHAVLGWTQQGFEYWVVSAGTADAARRLRAAWQLRGR